MPIAVLQMGDIGRCGEIWGVCLREGGLQLVEGLSDVAEGERLDLLRVGVRVRAGVRVRVRVSLTLT